MKGHLEIILNEYQAIKDFRERCIKNIEETTRTYLLFLGFGVTAFSFSLEKKLNSIFLIAILGICLFVGCFIYRLNIASHINFINYTKKLNITRSYFLKTKRIKKYILLPTSGDEPEFDRIGYSNKKFSTDGVLKLIQILDSLIGGILFIVALPILEQYFFIYFDITFKVILFIGIFVIVFLLHKKFNNDLVFQAKVKWEKQDKPQE